MLDRTFIHLPGYDCKKERRLWGSGILSWDDFIDRFSSSKFHKLQCTILKSSRSALQNSDGNYFGDMLPQGETWRAFPHFDKVAYLDIETTGLTPQKDYVTVIGVFDGFKTHSYIHGINLEKFTEDISKYDMVVTFNGSLFDIPFLNKHIPRLKMPRLHVDLRFVLASLNIYGGLKRIEQQFGFEREDDLKGMNGYDAVLLWKDYCDKNDKDALDRLVRYNAADISNLKNLMVWAYKEKRKRTGFDKYLSINEGVNRNNNVNRNNDVN